MKLATYRQAGASRVGLVDVRGHGVKGKQVHDANVVATMRANGIGRFNAADLQR
jgi:hypothetical protein